MKKLVIKIILIFFISSVYVGAESKGISTGETYLENFLANTKTLEANFHQTLRDANGLVLQRTKGKFYLSRPGKFRWDYASPYEQKIISDGKRIWIYDVSLEQVTVKKQSKNIATTPMALLDSNLKLHQQFKVKPLDNHDGIYRLKLSSKKNSGDFGEIVVGVDKHGLRFLQLYDQFDQTTDIVFDKMKINIRLPVKLFQFKPPKGVDVYGGS